MDRRSVPRTDRTAVFTDIKDGHDRILSTPGVDALLDWFSKTPAISSSINPCPNPPKKIVLPW